MTIVLLRSLSTTMMVRLTSISASSSFRLVSLIVSSSSRFSRSHFFSDASALALSSLVSSLFLMTSSIGRAEGQG